MAHNHNHNHMQNHSHNHSHESNGNIKIAFILNFSFTILEIIGGLLTNSMAILSDALHDLGDSLSLGIAWYLEKFSKKEPDQKFSYGYSRFSLLGALLNSVILVAGSVLIIVKSIPRIISPESVNSKGMFIFAIFGILINGIGVIKLKKGTTLNEKVVSWHLMEDVLGWVIVLIVSIVLMFVNIPVIDPILSVLITFYVLFNVIKNLKEILSIFLQGVPGNMSIEEMEHEIVEIAGVQSVHHTHIWSLEGEKNLLSTHLIVEDNIDRNEIIIIKKNIRELLERKGIGHVTIEVEYKGDDCGNRFCH